MADVFYSIDIGQGVDPSAVVVGASSSAAKHVEIRVLTGVFGVGNKSNKLLVENAISTLAYRILEDRDTTQGP